MVYGVFLILPLRLFPFFSLVFLFFSFFVLVLFCSCLFLFFRAPPLGFPLPFPLFYCGLLEFFWALVWVSLFFCVLFFFLVFLFCFLFSVCVVSSLFVLCVSFVCAVVVVCSFFFFEKTTPSVRWSSVFGVFAVVLTFS